MEFRYFIKTVPVNDRIHQQESLSSVHVLFPHGAELLRERRGRCDIDQHWVHLLLDQQYPELLKELDKK